jgi:hypothetical protein
MNTNQENNTNNKNNTTPESKDRFQTRRQRMEERRAARGSRFGGSWIGGAILIFLGVMILLQNYTSINVENWWALFILIPALGAFGSAWRAYQIDGKLSSPARASLIFGFLLTMVTAIFLLELDWGILGPVLLLLAGFGLLINAVLPG